MPKRPVVVVLLLQLNKLQNVFIMAGILFKLKKQSFFFNSTLPTLGADGALPYSSSTNPNSF